MSFLSSGCFGGCVVVVCGAMLCAVGAFPFLDAAGPQIKCLPQVAKLGRSATLTLDIRVRMDSVPNFVLSVSINSFTERPLLCHWDSTDGTPLSQACLPMKGFITSGIVGRQVNLTILNTTEKHLRTYTWTLVIGDETHTTSCELKQEEAEADSPMTCVVPVTQIGGTSTLTFDLGDRLTSARSFVLSVFRNNSTAGVPADRVLICHWTATDQSVVCDPEKGFVISDLRGQQVNLSISNTKEQHLRNYTLSLQTFPGGKTVFTTCELEGTSNTNAIVADNTPPIAIMISVPIAILITSLISIIGIVLFLKWKKKRYYTPPREV